MAPGRKLILKGKALLSKLTGISVPIAGVSWNPPQNEQDAVKRLFVFLSDRRALFEPFHEEIEHFVTQSVLQIRERIVKELEGAPRESPWDESLRVMAAACRDFLTATQYPPHRHHYRNGDFFIELGKLRSQFGVHLARLAFTYDLEVPETLAPILPPDTTGATSGANISPE